MPAEIDQIYGNRVRIRVCGLLLNADRLLLVNHRQVAGDTFWAPPGGGVEFGESAKSCLEREFLEETGLIVSVGEFRFMCEFIRPPLHAVELFFTVRAEGGQLRTGTDPEMKPGEQLIQSVKFLSWQEIGQLHSGSRHGVFNSVDEPSRITHLSGYVAV